MTRAERNKHTARAFYDLMFNECAPRKAVERYVGDEYIQHNPHVGDGKEAFIAYFERMANEFPGKKTLFQRAIADDEFVVLHCHQIWPATESAAAEEYAGIDIFRFDAEGRIVEHWDVLQPLPTESKNDNGMF
ncbi:MAG: nuclear transport factor 2 family protein [Acidobacteriota bacterium]